MELPKEEQKLLAAVARERQAVQESMTPEEALLLADQIISSPSMMFELRQQIFALSFKAHAADQKTDCLTLMAAVNVLCYVAICGEKEK